MTAELGFLFLLFLGGFMLVGAVFDWDRLRQDWRSRVMTKVVGKSGVRILQGLLGLLLGLVGVLGLLGIFG